MEEDCYLAVWKPFPQHKSFRAYNDHMYYSIYIYTEFLWGTTIGAIKGDVTSLDYGSRGYSWVLIWGMGITKKLSLLRRSWKVLPRVQCLRV